MYLNPQEIIAKVCKNCERQFESPRYFNKDYCSITCRRRAKTKRERKHELEAMRGTASAPFDERFFAVVSDPTEGELEQYASLVIKGLTKDKPIKFVGKVPAWTQPQSIDFVEQQVEPKEWLMFKHEVDILEMV